MFAAEVARGKNPDQQRNAANADQRDGIRQVHARAENISRESPKII
jgi:hypothetical protein